MLRRITIISFAISFALASAAHAGPMNAKPANLLASLKRGLSAARKNVSHKLRLDEAVLELSGTVATGKRGWWSLDVSPKAIFSGSKTGNRPVQFAMAPAATAQAYVATAGVGYIPGFERPITTTIGCGPFSYRPYDPIHHSPFFGLSIPLIGSVIIGPKLIGASILKPLPWAPVVSMGAGAYFSHPWLEPVTGTLWNLGVRLVNTTKPARDKFRAFVAAHPQIGRAAGRVRKLRGRVAGRALKLGKKIASRLRPKRAQRAP